MTNTNCTDCDKPDCPRREARDVFDAYPSDKAVDGNPEWEAITDAMWAANAVCERNTVNWRARALTAEARADAAEARIALATFIANTQAESLTTQSTEGNKARYIYLEGFADAGKETLEALGGKP